MGVVSDGSRRSVRDCRRAVKSSMSCERARCGKRCFTTVGTGAPGRRPLLATSVMHRGQLFVFLQVTQPSWREPNTLKDGVATEVKDLELMDFAAESEEMSGVRSPEWLRGAAKSRVRSRESKDGGVWRWRGGEWSDRNGEDRGRGRRK